MIAAATPSRTVSAHLPAVFPIGFGCMGLDSGYGAPLSQDDAIGVIRRAVDAGVTLFDTAELYGPFTNEERVGEALRPFGASVLVATKFGARIVDGRPAGLDSRPEHIVASAEASLRRLGRERIDLYYQHRVDPEVPIEEVAGAVQRLVEAGKVGAFGLCETSVQTLLRAHAVFPVAALQSEYSIWTRDPERTGMLDACAANGIGFVAFSPMGRGFLAGSVKPGAAFGEDDARAGMPRFQPAASADNAALAALIGGFARRHGISAGQLCLAWLLARGPGIVPLTGSRNPARIVENAAAATLALPASEWEAFDEAVSRLEVHGERYPEHLLAMTGR